MASSTDPSSVPHPRWKVFGHRLFSYGWLAPLSLAGYLAMMQWRQARGLDPISAMPWSHMMRQVLAVVVAWVLLVLLFRLWRIRARGVALLLVVLSGAIPVWFVTQPLAGSVASPAAEVRAEQLEAHVRHLSVDLYPRSQDSVANLDRAADYVRRELIAAGATVVEQSVEAPNGTSLNLIARFGPTVGPLMVIGAHYDSCPSALGFNAPTPGADDNASGVAGLLELARLLAAHPPARPVELVAYTREEPPSYGTPYMGSVRHARSVAEGGRPIRLMLSLEMIGFFTDRKRSQSFPLPGMGLLYPNEGNFVALAGRFGDGGLTRRAKALMAGASNLPVVSINAPRWVQGIDFSDHRSYWAEGFPALVVTDTAFYRNPNYHAEGDTYDTLDYRRMAQVVQGVYAVARQY